MAHPGEVERVYRDQAPKLWRSLVAWSGSGEIATDSVAEAFAQLLRRGQEVRDPNAWIWRAAFRIASGLMSETGSASDIQDLPVHEQGFERAEQADLLLRALARLPDRQRAVLILRYFADLSPSEIARTLTIAYPTVGVHLSQGRRRLREILEVMDE